MAYRKLGAKTGIGIRTDKQGTPLYHYRPRDLVAPYLFIISDWVQRHEGMSIAAVFNAFLPAMAQALTETMTMHRSTIWVKADFGDIPILRFNQIAPDEII